MEAKSASGSLWEGETSLESCPGARRKILIFPLEKSRPTALAASSAPPSASARGGDFSGEKMLISHVVERSG